MYWAQHCTTSYTCGIEHTIYKYRIRKTHTKKEKNFSPAASFQEETNKNFFVLLCMYLWERE